MSDLKKLKNVIEKEFKSSIKDELKEEKGNIVFEKDNDMFIIGRMPVPIPVEEIKQVAEHSLLYKDKKGIETKQKAHIIISVQSKTSNLIDNRIKLTKLVRSILLSTDAMGVYWGSSAQIIQKDIFIALTDNIKKESLPMTIWVSITVGRGNYGEINLYSTGLKDFGFPEFEVVDLKMPQEDAYYFLLDLAENIITLRDIIKEGHTVGRDANEKLKVNYMKSVLRENNNVMRIKM
ncbi:MAG: DUF4261 domain-containing protein [Candidatus Thermoplasmatota archaeon]|nr:DUF4261 domain-containing protein [Candidatus Thermoplasmatota archaeon]